MTGHYDFKQTAEILVVEDDPVQRRLLKNAIERHGHLVHQAENGRVALDMVRRDGERFGAIVLDLMMPEMSGLELLGALHELGCEAPVIVQTGQGGIETVVQAMRAGAFDFVVKPVSPERIGAAIVNALKVDHHEIKQRTSRHAKSGAVAFDDIVSASPAMIRVIELAQRAAQSTIPVVLEGESGVGKELVARAIQSSSERSNKPFVTVNCGAIPHNLVESILFGHERGAFTGATERHAGKFMEADGGTLFLDEVGDLPLDVQVKLLRAVQQGEIETVGARAAQKVNVRLISATNKDLIEEVKNGNFREDLYYRLNVFPITIPALRRRKEDIPHLARAFTERFGLEEKNGRRMTISAGGIALLTAYDWPGNIRQLENAVLRAVILSESDELTEADFPQIGAQLPSYGLTDRLVAAVERGARQAAAYRQMPRIGFEEPPPPVPQGNEIDHPAHAAAGAKETVILTIDPAGDVRKLADVEEELIRFALKFYRGQMSQVARKLGIGRSTLYRKLKDYGIDPDNPLKEAA